MKRFMLFAGETYYPIGGFGDFVASFDTLEEATAAPETKRDWWHVVDATNGAIAASESEKKYQAHRS